MTAGRTVRLRSADIWAGLFFVALGAGFLGLSFSHSFGALRDIGPGMFPALAGAVLALLGLGVILSGIATPVPVGRIAWRPLIGVLAPVVLFALLLKTTGLAASAAILVLVALVATGQAKIRTAILLALALSAAAVVIFGYALQLPLKLWP